MADGTSIWKKEIRLRKRGTLVVPIAATAAPEAKQSIWKRELRLGAKKRAVETVAPESRQPIFGQPPLWDSLPPDPPFAPAEPVSVALQSPAPNPVEPHPETSRETPSSTTQPDGSVGSSTAEVSTADASSRLPTWGSSDGEDVHAAPDPEQAAEPEWAAEGEEAPHDVYDLYGAELEADAEGPYGWTDAHEEPSEIVSPPAPTAGWPGLDAELVAAGGSEPSPAAPSEPDAGAHVEEASFFTQEAVGRHEFAPSTVGWSDSAPVETERLGAGETDAVPASLEPVQAPVEPTAWSLPATPEWPPAEAEPSATEPEPEIAARPLATEGTFESTGSAGWTQENAEPEASTSVGEPEPERSTPEPAPPASGWELPGPEAQAPVEPENLVPDADPVAVSKASDPKGAKPSLLKRELRLPRLRRRAPKPSAVKVAGAHPVKNIVGLRVGSSQLAAAYVHNNGAAELVQTARTPLARGIVAGGEVRDPEALTSALKKFFAEHKLPRRGIRLGIASNRIGVRILEVPALDDPRLFENSIRFHAQETLPISVSDAIIDHVVLGAGAGGGLEPMVRILLVFAHRELVDRHVQACRRAGLKLEGIDFEAFALLRALGAPRPEETEPTRAVVAVAIGQERTIFAVSDGRICDFTRVLEWGGGSLDVAIARALNLTPSQAEPLKLALSLDGDAAPSQLTPEQVEAARTAIRTELQSLSRELVSSLQFYQARSGSLDIGEIMLSGGGAQLAGLGAELERLVGVPVVTGDPFSRVEVGRKVGHPAESGSLAIAIGLGIED